MKNKSIYSVFTISIICLAVTVFAFIYMNSLVRANVEKSATAKRIIASEDKGKSENKELTDMMKKSETDRAKLDNYFVSEDDVVVFIEELEKLSDVANIKMDMGALSSVKGTADTKGIGSISLNMNISGTWQNVMKFIHLLELKPYRLSIIKVDLGIMSDGVKGKAPAVWRAGININVKTLKKDNSGN